jgi:chemotaxis response regulator CheB
MLNGTKPPILIKQVALEENISEELLSDVVNFYYKCLREDMEEFRHPVINVPYLGNFSASERKLKRNIAIINAIHDPNVEMSFKEHRQTKLTLELRDKQKALYDKIIERNEERDKRYQALGKKKRNPRRDKEQNL